MNKKNHLAEDILLKVQQGTATNEELAYFESWYLQYHSPRPKAYSEQELSRIRTEIARRLPVVMSAPLKAVSLWPKVAAVAASLAIIVFSIYYFAPHKQSTIEELSVTPTDLPPGKTGATLTLGNGKKIFIASAKSGTLANEAGVSITKDKNGQIIYSVERTQDAGAKGVTNTLATTRGEQVQVQMPDGSSVYLNAASSLTYPSSFAGSASREVVMTGEAYFEVAKDPAHPFVVKSGAQQVEVLGTHFNINSYPDERAIRTTLLEGSVKVNKKVILKPAQQSSFSANGLTVSQVDPDDFIAWKKGLFQFQDASLDEVMRQISRWYNVDVVYSAELPARKFNGKVYRNMSLNKVLQVLSISKVNYRIQGRKIYIIN